MSSNPEYGEVYSIQHVIKSVSNLPHIDGFLWVLQVASTNKTDSHRHDIIEIIIESGAKHKKRSDRGPSKKHSSNICCPLINNFRYENYLNIFHLCQICPEMAAILALLITIL